MGIKPKSVVQSEGVNHVLPTVLTELDGVDITNTALSTFKTFLKPRLTYISRQREV
jgi:hypothetical protein